MNDSHRIQFERPDLDELTDHYTVVDLHFHSNYSDGFNSVPAIVEKALDLGIGIALTDHNEIRGAVELSAHREVFSIPGIEVTSKEGTHLLVYFYDIESLVSFYHTHIEPFMGMDVMSSIFLDMEDIIDRARDYECLVVFPHPYCGSYAGIQNSYFTEERLNDVLEAADGIEVINSENLNKWNLRSALLGFNLKKCITGGSDGHRIYQMGRVVSYAKCAKTSRAFLNAVKKGKNMVIGKEIDLIHKVTSNGVKLRSNIRNYPDLVEKNLRYLNAKSRIFKDNMRRSLTEHIRDRRRRSNFR
jgi:predicted metal-dependent phosphoesterase TrpH